ncbi:hypothetical protein XEUV206_22240 [Xanthomonas euvesicatoria]|uniref:DUF4145 domain-containing protein n=3 Tax=Xanthomonas euvesicatoria TaxID=456327 RepID=Q3BZ65_XANE5|nr:hypothetical protein BHE83_16000 [Xanthomonas euvesicatoria pv. vesicatoria str. 85-10]APO92307.1 hypothetical protein BJD11_21825 [Xanthomonas euvesicatoria]KLB37700.1 hypothetical protein XEUV206_22240 [Xanthomonas euvesicatoria]CAJ21848.1 hypothetical protein XCV0217 [Xanthomonas euvesicatoria pv. vesicatoria str. 85-10]
MRWHNVDQLLTVPFLHYLIMMERIEDSPNLTPKNAEPWLSDLFSDTISAASKGNAARRYAEMMIDLFLSDRLKEEIGEAEFRRLFLGDHIKQITPYTPPKIIEDLWHIKNFGDKASHYSPVRNVTHEEASGVVKAALGLIDLILTQELIERPLNVPPCRATIFSVIFPGVRERVLENLLKECSPDAGDYYLLLVNKYSLALVKNLKFNKARRNLDDLLKKGSIDEEFHVDQVESIKLIAGSIRYPGQPIPKRMADVARNYAQVRGELDEADLEANQRLLKIMDTLVNNVVPSGNAIAGWVLSVDEPPSAA